MEYNLLREWYCERLHGPTFNLRQTSYLATQFGTLPILSEWDEEEMECTLSDGTVQRVGDAAERQRMIAAHVREVVRAALVELTLDIQPARVPVYSEWGEFAGEWNNKLD